MLAIPETASARKRMRNFNIQYLTLLALLSSQRGGSSGLVAASSGNLDPYTRDQSWHDARRPKVRTLKHRKPNGIKGAQKRIHDDHQQLPDAGTAGRRLWLGGAHRVPKTKISIPQRDGSLSRPSQSIFNLKPDISSSNQKVSPFVSTAPSSSPTKTISYVPGKLTNAQNGLLLSEGLQSKIIARALTKVELADGSFSRYGFHQSPDGAAVFPDPDTGGWIYVSNSERENGDGGVGGIFFNADGEVIDYKSLQAGTSWNCSGGKTPWNTWVSCEEIWNGRIWQVDPFGVRPPQETSLSATNLGYFESFAYDIRDFNNPRFFVTEDAMGGALRRFTPSNPNWDDPWSILHGEGVLEYLVLDPSDGNHWDTVGTFYWTTSFRVARNNAARYYQHTEGLDVYNNELFVVSKTQHSLFILDLDNNTYQRHSTSSGLFDGQPDQMKRLIKNGPSNVESSRTFDANEPDEEPLLYFCEEVGTSNGIHARDANGWFYTILESNVYGRETSGLAFSPDGKHMYFSFQAAGVIFDIFREDGLPFYGKSLDVHFHGKPDTPDKERDMWST